METLPTFTQVMVTYTDGSINNREDGDTMVVNQTTYPILTPSDYWIGPRTVLLLTIDKTNNTIEEANIAIGLCCETRVPLLDPQNITIEFTAMIAPGCGATRLAKRMLKTPQ